MVWEFWVLSSLALFRGRSLTLQNSQSRDAKVISIRKFLRSDVEGVFYRLISEGWQFAGFGVDDEAADGHVFGHEGVVWDEVDGLVHGRCRVVETALSSLQVIIDSAMPISIVMINLFISTNIIPQAQWREQLKKPWANYAASKQMVIENQLMQM